MDKMTSGITSKAAINILETLLFHIE